MRLKRWSIFSIILLIPFITRAQSNDELVKVAENTKYLKTVTILSNSEVMRNGNMGEISSLTTEITEEEYNNVDPSTENTISPQDLETEMIETTYKKLTTTMWYYYGFYRYSSTLDWKLIPSTRSYDIFGIGHYATVRISGEVEFDQYYCRSASECYDSTAYYSNVFTNGATAVFKIPSGTIYSLSQKIEFDVTKTDSSDTITRQLAVGDYAHAQSSISATNAQKHSIGCGGLELNSSIESYYDDITETDALWTGTW